MMSSNVMGLDNDSKKQQENQPVQPHKKQIIRSLSDPFNLEDEENMRLSDSFNLEDEENMIFDIFHKRLPEGPGFERAAQKLINIFMERMRRSSINFQKHLDSFLDNQKELFQDCIVLVSMVEKFRVSTLKILMKQNRRDPDFRSRLVAVMKLRERQMWYWYVQKKVHFPPGEDLCIRRILNVPSKSFCQPMDASKLHVLNASQELAAHTFDWIRRQLLHCGYNYEQRLLLSQEIITLFNMMDVTIENRERHMDSPSTKFSPIEFPIESIVEETKNINHGIPLVLELKNTYLVQSILVGVVVHATPPEENLEFYFFNARDMAICVGVSLDEAKVIICNDLSITIKETSVSEWLELQATWLPFVRDNSCHLVMEVQMETPAATTGTQAKQEQSSLLQHGVGFECDAIYIDETNDVGERSWPLLYDMALFILTSSAVQCNETKGKSSAQGECGSFQATNQDNNMAHRLQEKRDNVSGHKNSQGEGDGDEDGSPCDLCESQDDENSHVVSKIKVIPLPKQRDFFRCGVAQSECNGLEGISILPTLLFEFRRNGANKSISIETHAQLELGSTMDIFCNEDMFGWYHDNILISFGCDNIEDSHEGVALLEPKSIKILNDLKPSWKYNAGKFKSSTEATTLTTGGGAKFEILGSGLQGSSSGSSRKQEETNASENIEMTVDCMCEGFLFRNSSRAASPAHVSFLLFYPYPLDESSIWGCNRRLLQGQGLFSTIVPSLEATWIPLNEDTTSPYFFKVERSLNLRMRGEPGAGIFEKQSYNVPFYVNHAMTHLRRTAEPMELRGSQLCVPNVLMVGSVHV